MPAAVVEQAERSPSVQRSDAPVAVVDIGSNSVRLVVFERLSRSPIAIFNEKVLCGLVRDMETTGHLDGEAVDATLKALGRFRQILSLRGVNDVEVVATAAVRDARNGAEFVAQARNQLGFKITVLSGEEEASFAARGVLAGIPDADGIVGDLGGGSLELTPVADGAAQAGITLPFGSLRLKDYSKQDMKRARDAVFAAFEKLPKQYQKKKTLYAVGGVWRAIARIQMDRAEHPIRILHHYEILRNDALKLSAFLSGLSRKSLPADVGRRRAEALPYGALVMECLMEALDLRRIVISAYGVREGVLFSKLRPEQQSEDPLIASCRDLAERAGRGIDVGEALDKWIAPLFADKDTLRWRRLRQAACLLSEVGWREHPDHRAEQSFIQALNEPFVGIDHEGRALLSLALYHRYGGESVDEAKHVERIENFLGDEDRETAELLGTAMRAAMVLGGASASILNETSLKLTARNLTLVVPQKRASLIGEAVDKRFKDLADAVDRPWQVDYR